MYSCKETDVSTLGIFSHNQSKSFNRYKSYNIDVYVYQELKIKALCFPGFFNHKSFISIIGCTLLDSML